MVDKFCTDLLVDDLSLYNKNGIVNITFQVCIEMFRECMYDKGPVSEAYRELMRHPIFFFTILQSEYC